MAENNAEALAALAAELGRLDGRLRELSDEVRSRAGGLSEETAETLLDRLDELMDLLYLMDERLAGLAD